jgi:hypothetical protein
MPHLVISVQSYPSTGTNINVHNGHVRNSTQRNLCKASIYTICKTVHFHREKDTLFVQMYTFTKVCQQTPISHSTLSTKATFRFNNLLQRMQQKGRLSLQTEVRFSCPFSCYTSPQVLMVKLNLPMCLIKHIGSEELEAQCHVLDAGKGHHHVQAAFHQ